MAPADLRNMNVVSVAGDSRVYARRTVHGKSLAPKKATRAMLRFANPDFD